MQTNKVKTNIEPTHIADQNSTSLSSGGEEQKRTPVVGQLAGKCALAHVHAWEGGKT